VPTLTLEIFQRDSWELGSTVVLSLILVHLMDWDCGVNNGRLNGFLLYNWLDCFVDVMMDVLAYNNTGITFAVFNITNLAGILELLSLGCYAGFDVLIVAVTDVTVFNTKLVVCVCSSGRTSFALMGWIEVW